MRTTTARLATVFHASGFDFSVSILTARDGLPEVTDRSLTASAQHLGPPQR